MIHGYPNGATRYREAISSRTGRQTRGTETSKYPQEKKTKVIPSVAASERGTAQTGVVSAMSGLKDCDIEKNIIAECNGKCNHRG